MIKRKNPEFNKEEILLYKSVPAKQKMRHLKAVNKFLQKIRPPQNNAIARLLKEKGF